MPTSMKIWFTNADSANVTWNTDHTVATVIHTMNCYPLVGVWTDAGEQIFPTVTCLDGYTFRLDFGRVIDIVVDHPWRLTIAYGGSYDDSEEPEESSSSSSNPSSSSSSPSSSSSSADPEQINPFTGQEYYSGHWTEVVKYCRALNIDQGRLSAVRPLNIVQYQAQVDGIIDGYFSESYFLPITKYNQVDVNGEVHLVFPQRLRYLAQQMVAGLLMLSEFQHQEQNMNEAGKTMFEEAKKEVYQMTLWNHRIPGQRYKSRTGHTMPPGFEPGHELIEQIWSMT